MSDAYVGEIRLIAFNWAPQGWLLCQGQQLLINQYQALYALIGTAYGGDGATTFKLPDLRGRVPTQQGQGPLAVYNFAQAGGITSTTVSANGSVTLSNVNQLPLHTPTATFTPTGGGAATQPTITVNASKDAATSAAPLADGYFAAIKPPSVGVAQLGYTATATTGLTALNAATATASGGSGGGITGGSVTISPVGAATPAPAPVTVGVQVPPQMAPFLAMNYAICVNGIFPSRP
nr:tail fiber protein [uncultured Duganella sp.]